MPSIDNKIYLSTVFVQPGLCSLHVRMRLNL